MKTLRKPVSLIFETKWIKRINNNKESENNGSIYFFKHWGRKDLTCYSILFIILALLKENDVRNNAVGWSGTVNPNRVGMDSSSGSIYNPL